jgi:DNA-binding winged helix-turn-helix (wHTH) protein/Tol biopolymer transport system component
MSPTEQSSKSVRLIRFGGFALDLSTGELRTSGSKTTLQDQPLHIIKALLEHPGELISREELVKTLWPAGTFVDFDHGLNRAVNKLREALQDSADNPRFIETLARRGYRFIAPVDGANGVAAPIGSKTLPETRKSSRSWPVLSALVLVLAVLGLAWYIRDRPHRQYIQQNLTANPVENPVLAAAISPDGKYLAYSDDNGVSLKIIDTGTVHLLPETKDLVIEDWFPDGNQVLAIRDSKVLWAVPILGGTGRKLHNDVRAARVSPDGSRILFLSGRDIWVMGANGEEPHQVLSGAEPNTFWNLAWAPGGMRFAYIRHGATGGLRVETSGFDKSRPTVVFSGQQLTGTGECGLLWLAGGRFIFVSYDENGSSLWTIHVDPHTGEVAGHEQLITNATDASIDTLSASTDGKRLVFLLARSTRRIAVAELAEAGKRLKSPSGLSAEIWPTVPSAWTNDSHALLFVSYRAGKVGLFKQGMNQRTSEELLVGPENYGSPEPSPDGGWLLYWILQPEEIGSRLMRMPIAGGPPELVLTTHVHSEFHCGLRGHRCVLGDERENEHGRKQVVFSSLDPVKGRGSVLQKLDIDSAFPYYFALSPDGTQVALVQQTDEILLQNLSTGAVTKMALKQWPDLQFVAWSADGKSVFVSVFASGTWNNALLHVGLDSKTRVLLRTKHVWLGFPKPSPDGRYLAFAEASDQSNVAMIEDF